jgi:hypothetical protein
VKKAAEPCMQTGSKIPIDERYTCPVGNFDAGNSLSLTRERVECSIQIALSIEAIDRKAALWTKELQSSREKDINVWVEDIRKKVKSDSDSFENQYNEVCSLTGWTIALDEK